MCMITEAEAQSNHKISLILHNPAFIAELCIMVYIQQPYICALTGLCMSVNAVPEGKADELPIYEIPDANRTGNI